jgi:hypothetical protein
MAGIKDYENLHISTVYRYLQPDNYSDALSLRYHPRQKFTQKIEKDNVLGYTCSLFKVNMLHQPHQAW